MNTPKEKFCSCEKKYCAGCHRPIHPSPPQNVGERKYTPDTEDCYECVMDYPHSHAPTPRGEEKIDLVKEYLEKATLPDPFTPSPTIEEEPVLSVKAEIHQILQEEIADEVWYQDRGCEQRLLSGLNKAEERLTRRLEIEREKGRKELEDEIREGLGKRWDLYTKDDILEFLERRNLYRATPETKK